MIELLGFAGSGLIITSLMMRSIHHLRIVGIIGAATFIIYGCMLQAWPVVTTNCITLLINAVHLHRLARDTNGDSAGSGDHGKRHADDAAPIVSMSGR